MNGVSVLNLCLEKESWYKLLGKDYIVYIT